MFVPLSEAVKSERFAVKAKSYGQILSQVRQLLSRLFLYVFASPLP